MDKIIEKRIRLQAQSMDSYYKKHFIPNKPSGESWLKIRKEYKAILGLGVIQGFTIQHFTVDHWWKLQNTFEDVILEKTKPLIFLEIKAKKYMKDKQPQKAAVCIKEFKRISPVVSILVFEYLFGKNTYFAYHDAGIVYRRDIILP